ncbi:MAG: Na(+)-translocating NADH-quinone reductase subunit A [Woeseiaceae bacterium]|nr:Na(+)-translocating NADH-quinone reductase subunit A [Woeseiaceae bacterium]
MRITIRKGLDIPIAGRPEQVIDDGNSVASVAVMGTDIIGIRPRMHVQEGDRVRLGQPVFTDKRNPGVHFTAPGTGVVTAINRGARRSLQSVVIRLEGDDAVEFESFAAERLPGLGYEAVRDLLLESGLWNAFRTRPFSHIPAPDARPAALFVNAMDTNPLAADPAVIINAAPEDFKNGLALVAQLTEGPVYVSTRPDSGIAVPERAPFRHAEFAGPHPAGLVGTHIHFLEPVSEHKTVWHTNYQRVIAIGRLATSGRLPTEKIIALGGPMVTKPRLLRTRIGASTTDLLAGELAPGRKRIISGSVLGGHRAAGPLAYLGRYHNQVSVLEEGTPREFMHWMRPGTSKFSSVRAYLGHLVHREPFRFSTTQNGSPRAMVSIGNFEQVMPLDILPTPLLKALIVEDTDRARELGALELDEEDLALCSFVCNGKYDYGPYLRMNLDEIEVNG